MEYSIINKIKGPYRILRVNNLVVVYGTKLYILNLIGEILFCCQNVSNVYNVVLLPNNMLLADGGAYYYCINLYDGTVLWTVKHSRRDFPTLHFALSPCGKYAYYINVFQDKYILDVIDLVNVSIQAYVLNNELRSIHDMICEPNGELALLRTHYSVIADRKVSENGIQFPLRDPFTPGYSYYWKNKWMFDGMEISRGFLKSADTVITSSLKVFTPSTGILEDLLTNESIRKVPNTPHFTSYLDFTGQYLIIAYQTCNAVIDLKKHCVIAEYSGENVRGNIVDNEFWMSSDRGVIRYKFKA